METYQNSSEIYTFRPFQHLFKKELTLRHGTVQKVVTRRKKEKTLSRKLVSK